MGKRNKKIVLSPEAAEVIAEANAANNGTSVEEEKALIQAAMERDTATTDSKKPSIWKEISGAVMRNGGGIGGSDMSGLQPKIQQVQEENKVLDEVAEATGQRPATILGHPVGQAVHSEDVAQDLNDRDIAVKDEYKEKHPEVFSEDGNQEIENNIASIGEVNDNDSHEVKAAKGKYNKSMMSIWDAYYNGELGLDENGEPSKDAKARAMYYTVDAIATLAKNLGRSIGNVGAQFSGGTIDNGHDTSMWEQRQNKLFNTELQAESEEVKTFDNILKGYQTNRAATVNDMLNDFRAKANDPSLPETEKRFYQVLAAQLAGAGMDRNTQIASVAGGVWDDIRNAILGIKNNRGE